MIETEMIHGRVRIFGGSKNEVIKYLVKKHDLTVAMSAIKCDPNSGRCFYTLEK